MYLREKSPENMVVALNISSMIENNQINNKNLCSNNIFYIRVLAANREREYECASQMTDARRSCHSRAGGGCSAERGRASKIAWTAETNCCASSWRCSTTCRR